MSAILGNALVGLTLSGSVLYALLALGPQSWRRAIRGVLGMKAKPPVSPASCGGCGGCSGDAAASPSATEVNIPVTKIGRR